MLPNNTYEDWEDKYYNIANYNASNGTNIKQLVYKYNNYIDYMQEVMDLTYKIARIQGTLIAKEKDEDKEGKDVQPPSELKKMFPGVRYVDRLEVTGGYVFPEHYEIPELGYYSKESKCPVSHYFN